MNQHWWDEIEDQMIEGSLIFDQDELNELVSDVDDYITACSCYGYGNGNGRILGLCRYRLEKYCEYFSLPVPNCTGLYGEEK